MWEGHRFKFIDLRRADKILICLKRLFETCPEEYNVRAAFCLFIWSIHRMQKFLSIGGKLTCPVSSSNSKTKGRWTYDTRLLCLMVSVVMQYRLDIEVYCGHSQIKFIFNEHCQSERSCQFGIQTEYLKFNPVTYKCRWCNYKALDNCTSFVCFLDGAVGTN